MRIRIAMLIFSVLLFSVVVNSMPEEPKVTTVQFEPLNESDTNGKGTWARMSIKDNGANPDTFSFNGHKLESERAYRLIRLSENLGSSAQCLGPAEISSKAGGVRISANMRSGGEQLVLAYAEDVNCNNLMNNWNPDKYLFATTLI